MHSRGSINQDSYEFRAAAENSRGAAPRAGGNTQLLADSRVADRVVALLGDFDNGRISLDTFRGRLQDLGVFETPEATRMLRQPHSLSLSAFMAALKSGNEQLSGATFGAPPGSRPATTTVLSNIDAPPGSRPALTAREDRSNASVWATAESGVHKLLQGRGEELPSHATQPEVGDAAYSAAHATHRARTVKNAAQVPSGAHVALRGELALLPSAHTQPHLERVRHILDRAIRALAQQQGAVGAGLPFRGTKVLKSGVVNLPLTEIAGVGKGWEGGCHFRWEF
jgi:hypothetical protein